MGKEVLQEAKGILKNLREIGKQQAKSFKEDTGTRVIPISHHSKIFKSTKEGIYVPSLTADTKYIIEQNSFLMMMVEGFWGLFQAISQDIDLPIIQLALRTQLETVGRIIYFISHPKKRKEVATKYWLLNIGRFSSSGKGSKKWKRVYEKLIGALKKESDKNFFKNLRRKNFPLTDISRKASRLFPRLDVKRVYPQTKFLWGDIDRKKISQTYSFLSTLTHGNIFLVKGIQKKDNKEHLFSSFLACFLAAERVIRSFEEFNKAATFNSKKMKTISKDFRGLFSKLYKFSKS